MLIIFPFIVGGIPASTEYSGEMWDFPNAWAPLQYLLIEGIEKIGTPIASEVAFHFADKFIQATVKGYSEHGTIFQSVRHILAQNLVIIKKFK